MSNTMPKAPKSRLKRCPCCDGLAQMRFAVGEYWVECVHCGVSTRMESIEQNVIDIWNKRLKKGGK